MSNPERPNLFDELTKCSNDIYGSPLHGDNAMNYLQWLRFPVGQIWYDKGKYFVSPVLHGHKDPQEIEVPYGTSEEIVLRHGTAMAQQEVCPPYEIVAREPVAAEKAYNRQTLAVLDKGPYSIKCLGAYVRHRKVAEHTLHGSLGALFDTLSVVAGAKRSTEVTDYQQEERCVTRARVVEVINPTSSTRIHVLNRLIDAALSRQVQFLEPDRKGELLLQGSVGFGSRTPVIDWQAMPLDGFNNLIARHKPSSSIRLLLEQLAQS